MASVDELRTSTSHERPPRSPPELADLGRETRGNRDALKLRLAKATRLAAVPPLPPAPPRRLNRPPGESYDAFLVLDVEATCERIEGVYGRLAFAFPNELVEFPVVLLKWEHSGPEPGDDEEPAEGEGQGREHWRLVVVDSFQSFVRPTWRPQLSAFCTELTGIKQSDVDAAPTYPSMLRQFHDTFIVKHGLFTKACPTVFCCDGPWDLRDFIAKQSHISQVARPSWLAGPMIDLRILTSAYFSDLDHSKKALRRASRSPSPAPIELSVSPTAPALCPPSPTLVADAELSASKAPTQLSLPFVLLALDLEPFEGRLHSGICDARNAARILVELARRQHPLLENRMVPEGGRGSREKRWGWMGSQGKVAWESFLEKEKVKEALRALGPVRR